MTQDQVGLEMIKLGYDSEETGWDRCLNFLVGFDTLEGAKEAVNVIASYNNFNKDVVNVALDNIYPKLKYGKIIYVGRESSPAIYIEDFGMDKETAQDIMAHLKAAYADEVTFNSDSKIRAWWD